ncbi:MAG: hypothetical protein ACR2OD_13025, partial [Gaiellaceae bacterium]
LEYLDRNFCHVRSSDQIIAKLAGLPMKEGDLLRIVTPSGGGYGDPFDRDPELVLRDVEDGLVPADQADAAYGVRVNNGTVDEAATAKLRQARAKESS